MKRFYYDTLLDEENICGLKKERGLIERAIRKGSKMVIYGPRNFGKTSLVKNVVLPAFRADRKKSFALFADLMEVKSLESINQRMSKSFEIAFSQSFPARNFMEDVKRFLGSLRPEISFDPNTGAPSLSIASYQQDKKVSCREIFKTILDISKERDAIVVLDEFQDVAFVDEAQGLFRSAFQELKEIPIIIMGSKRHILSNILARPSAPLSMFGEDIEFGPIPYDEYHNYILERFKEKKLTMSVDDATYLQDLVLRVPEAINIVCAEIMDENENKKIGREEICRAVGGAVERRQSRHEEYLSHFSENEESVLISIAKQGPVKHPNSRDFLKTVRPTSRMVGIIVKHLLDKSVLDHSADGYFVCDPLFAFYIRHYR